MKDALLPIILAVIASSAFTKLIDWLLNRADTKNPSKCALKLLLQDKIEHLASIEIVKGHVSLHQYKLINEMYETYKTLNGNGQVKHVMDDFNKLPIDYN